MFTESLADAGRKPTSSALELRATASRSADASAPRSGAVSLAPPRSAVSRASRPGADAAPPAAVAAARMAAAEVSRPGASGHSGSAWRQLTHPSRVVISRSQHPDALQVLALASCGVELHVAEGALGLAELKRARSAAASTDRRDARPGVHVRDLASLRNARCSVWLAPRRCGLPQSTSFPLPSVTACRFGAHRRPVRPRRDSHRGSRRRQSR